MFKAQCRDLSAGADAARARVLELDERLKKMQASETEARAELSATKEQLNKIAVLQKQLDAAQRDNERLSQELHQSNTKLTLEKELTAHLTCAYTSLSSPLL